MDAVNFLQERARMCNSFSPDCEGCRVDEEKPVIRECYRWMFENPERSVKIVEEWTAAHPRKTRQSVFLEQFPNAKVVGDTNIPMVYPCQIYQSMEDVNYCNSMSCADCRREFWMQEME